MTNREGDSAHASPNAQKIAHEIETQLHAGHPLHSVLHDEIHALRKLDSQNGHLNKGQFAKDIQQVDAQLHKDNLLTNLHIVDRNDHAKLEKYSHYFFGKRPAPDLENGAAGKSREYKSAPGLRSSANQGDSATGDQSHPARRPSGLTTPRERQGSSQPQSTDTAAPDLNARRAGNDALPPTSGNDTLPPNPEQSSDRADSNNPNLAHLQDAVRRANAGGAPVRILQYGDSHVAGGTEPKSIEAGFSQIAPVNYSTMAKVGISASYPLQHEQSWINQPLQDKKPDLVILSFGSNDAAGQVNKQAYERQYEQLVQKIQQQSPNSSIMIVGPTDGYGSGTGKPLPGLDNVIAAQKEVAAKYGLDFVDMRASMGGAGSINDWRARGLAGPDKLHFTTKGYQLIAQQISNRLQSDVNGQGDYA